LRKRLFIVGIKGDITFQFPTPTHQESINQFEIFEKQFKHWNGSFSAIKDIPENTPNGDIVNHQIEIKERFEQLSFGERDHIRRRNRLDPDRPSFTIFAGGSKGGSGARTHIHPYENRELTPRECARLHGFPDNYIFIGSRDNIILQVANSVPVPLSEAMSGKIFQYFSDNTEK